jgi:archaeal flagellar protein FlaH
MADNIPDQIKRREEAVISTGNSELDKRIADGLPLQSLTLIEGENDTGKSVLTQQIMYWAMKQGVSVDLFTTEHTTKSFVKQMESMSLDVSEYFAWGYLKVFPLHVVGFEWTKDEMANVLACLIGSIGQSRAPVAIIDSLTLFTEYVDTDTILSFFTECKTLVDRGKTVIITLHTYAFEEETLVRIRAISDAHLMLKKALVGDKYVMVLEIQKVRGARKTTGNLVSFEVHPGYGMKVIPMSFARV